VVAPIQGWLVLFAILAVFLIVPIVAWTAWLRRPRPRPWPLLVLAIAATAPLASGWVGVVVALVQLQIRPPERGDDVEPSDKARVLAETISETMNRMVYAVVAATLVCAIAIVATRLLRRYRSR
jgi:hypothetical protein